MGLGCPLIDVLARVISRFFLLPGNLACMSVLWIGLLKLVCKGLLFFQPGYIVKHSSMFRLVVHCCYNFELALCLLAVWFRI